MTSRSVPEAVLRLGDGIRESGSEGSGGGADG